MSPERKRPYPLAEKSLPDYLSVTRRVRVSCGCVRGVDTVSGLAVLDQRKCREASR